MPTNNTTPILVAIDHGYGNTKTEHTIFPSGVTLCANEPATARNKLYWNGHWYAIGEEHKEFVADKTADDDYRLLTMVAIAKELELRNMTEATVHLAVGLPLTWYSQQKESFRRYLMEMSICEFTLNGVTYCVDIEGVDVFMQGFAAVVDQLDSFTGMNMLCDIGNGTMSIMYINNGCPVGGKCYTEKLGTYQCTLAIREAVMQQLHFKVEECMIEDVLRTNTAAVSERVLDVIRETATK